MNEDLNFLKQLNFEDDFTAVSFNEWQLDEVRRKPFNLVRRLRKVKQHRMVDKNSVMAPRTSSSRKKK